MGNGDSRNINGRTISRVAARAGVGVETIRYYQRRGLIRQPPKPDRGYRQYPADTVERLRFIKRAQALGFTLAEIQTLLEMGDGSCSETRALAQQKLAAIRTRLRDLRALHDVLSELVRACERNPGETGCPVIGALTKEDGSSP